MNDNIVESLKKLYKSQNGSLTWQLDVDTLKSISLTKNNRNLFEDFLERYYYMALNVIFKNDEMVRNFNISLSSYLINNKRGLYFSKKAFLRNFITNIDEMVKKNGESVYEEIKKEIRTKKDIYRDVAKLGIASSYYNEVKNEFLICKTDISFEKFVLECKKKYTRLLSGYNAAMQFFDKEINLEQFFKCFNSNQLYLYTMIELLGKIKDNYNLIDEYKIIVNKIREYEPFYNTLITIDGVIWTIDDLFKAYEEYK